MSFSGKRFRRTGGSNLDEFFKGSDEQVKKMLMSNAPTWCYTMMDPQTIRLEVQSEGFNFNHTYKLGVEHELTKVDGSKAYVTFTLEGDNVLTQRVRKPNAAIAYLKREFNERTATMTITKEEPDVRKAHVFYEVVD